MTSAKRGSSSPTALRTDRRGFLKLSGTAGLVTLAGLPALPGCASDAVPGDAFFSETEREILATIVERMVDTGEPDAPAVRDTRALDVIDASCAKLSPDVTGLLPVALRLFEWWPFFGELRFQRFTQLSPEERDESLRGWMESRVGTRRLAFYALRNLSLLGYWSQDETWPLIGYRGPLLRGGAPS